MGIFANSQLLTAALVNIHQDISKYMFIGALAACLANIIYELFTDFLSYCIKINTLDSNCLSMNPAPGGGAGVGANVGGPGGAGPGPGAGAGAAPGAGAPPFNVQGNRYNIMDPSGVAARGYIDPTTGLPYQSSQPYLRNWADALQHQLHISGQSTSSLTSDKYGLVE
jgi:hypothetical protein